MTKQFEEIQALVTELQREHINNLEEMDKYADIQDFLLELNEENKKLKDKLNE